MARVRRELPFSKRRQLEKAGNGIGMTKVAPLDAPAKSFRFSRRLKPAAVIAADIWREGLVCCEVCPYEGTACSGPIQGHHVIGRQKLKRLGLTDFLLDKRNRLGVCEYRHEQHTTGYKPIPRAVLPQAVFEFAEELGLTWYLEKHYVDRDEVAA